MALVYESRKSRERKDVKLYRSRFIFFIVILLIFLLLFVDQLNTIKLMILGSLGFLVTHQFFSYRKAKRRKQENIEVLEKFKELPDSYYVFEDVPVQHDGRGYTIDILVMAPQCNFAFMELSTEGTVTGQVHRDAFIQRYNKQGKPKGNQVFIPTSILRQQVWHGAQMWKEMGAPVWVEGSLYFSNPDTKVNMQTEDLPVFDNWESVKDFLIHFEPPFIPSDHGREIMFEYAKKKAKAKMI